MKSFFTPALILSALTLSACVAPVDTPNTGAVVVPVPVGVPVLVKENKDSIHVCKVKAFTETYRAENTSRGKARLDVLKQCQAKHHEMFCRDEDVECTEYD
ncbi:hypothetical protein [Moraxella bovis]|uniref:hypothetical protein n=1 Tax=Moraxella bovis TaxID=476 RepID=UPI00227C2A42|nr:hypothetical protein [Moraxella bovis]WAJ73248.1 hypothetical protein LP095_11035 [Moraxella bovis]